MPTTRKPLTLSGWYEHTDGTWGFYSWELGAGRVELVPVVIVRSQAETAGPPPERLRAMREHLTASGDQQGEAWCTLALHGHDVAVARAIELDRQIGATTKDELSEHIRKAAERTIDLEWTRYLVITYEATAWPEQGDSGRPRSNGSYSTLGISDDRAELMADPDGDRWSDRHTNRLITAIDLHWAVTEFTQPFVPVGGPRPVRMQREVTREIDTDDERGTTYHEEIASPIELDDDQLPPGAVLWTAEREALLRAVLAALGKLDARMVEMFRGDPDQLARRIDAAALNPARLLATSQEADDE